MKRSNKHDQERLLSPDFQPSSYSVKLVAAKRSREIVGNQRLRVIASSGLVEYIQIQKTIDLCQNKIG